MPAPVEIDLASLGGPWPVIALTGATGAGSGMNVDYALAPAAVEGKPAWANSTKTIEAASNGDWLVKSGSTVLYRKTGSKPWPWTAGSWTGENSGTGTLALARKNATPQRSAAIDETAEYAGDAPVRIAGIDPVGPSTTVTGTLLSDATGVLAYDGKENGKSRWKLGSTRLYYEGGKWWLEKSSISLTYSANKTSTADTPHGLTDWSVTVGTGQPSISVASTSTAPPVSVNL